MSHILVLRQAERYGLGAHWRTRQRRQVGMMSVPKLRSIDFRQAIQQARAQFPHLWDDSRKFVASEKYKEVLLCVIAEIRKGNFETQAADQVIEVLTHFRNPQSAEHAKRYHRILKESTGLPPSKAVRALIVWGLSQQQGHQISNSEVLSPSRLEALLRQSANPYDLLFHVSSPSLLDVGAGDLSFEQELVDYYRGNPILNKQSLVLHAFDRLNPASKVGGVYHRNRDREQFLKSLPSQELQFRFWGDMDMGAFAREKQRLSHYTIVTCHAPANPTFAYEPSRLSVEVIKGHLRSTRGEYSRGRLDGEPVLAVSHRGRVLTFPHWKFEILGPLRLLEFISRRAAVGVLSAVDDEVFWEILSQLLEDDRYRPPNQILESNVRRDVFGALYDRLHSLKPGERLDLSTMVKLRTDFSQGERSNSKSMGQGGLSFLEIRRGAVWPGVPSSFTARQFHAMNEESEPWWIIMVWDHHIA
ncbi:MAG: hypothetical protein AB7T38_16120 [Nitrospirales bacterium]